jgi:hypothetical protein
MLAWLQSQPLLSSNRLMPVFVVMGFALAAAAAGAVVAVGNIMLIAVAIGALVGVLLLNVMGLVVWMVLVGTLLVAGPLILQLPSLSRLQWLFSMLGFLMMGASILYAGTNRDPHRPSAPLFVPVAVLFVVYAVSTLFISEGSVAEGAGAIKRHFQYWGLMFALTAVAFSARIVRQWLVFLLLVALVQLPFALYQKIVLVPQRVNMPNGVVPVDIVAGTFEASMTGAGNNNVMVFFVIVAIATLLAAYREGMLRLPTLLVLLAVLGMPLGLGETKTALVLFPLAMLGVFYDQIRKRPIVFAMGSIVMATMLGGLFYVYVALQSTDSRTGVTFQQRLEENIEYNFGSRGYFAGASLNRGNVVPFWWSRHSVQTLQPMLFGHGLGASNGSVGTDARGHVDRKYPGYMIGLTGVSSLLWDLGLVGLALYLATLVSALVAAVRLVARAGPGFDRMMCRGLVASTSMMIALIFVSDLMLLAPSMQVIMAMTLGLIAWRWRVGRGLG